MRGQVTKTTRHKPHGRTSCRRRRQSTTCSPPPRRRAPAAWRTSGGLRLRGGGGAPRGGAGAPPPLGWEAKPRDGPAEHAQGGGCKTGSMASSTTESRCAPTVEGQEDVHAWLAVSDGAWAPGRSNPGTALTTKATCFELHPPCVPRPSPFATSTKASFCGVVTMTAALMATVWHSVSWMSPVPGGKSRIR